MTIIGIVGSRRRNKQKDFNAVHDAFMKVYSKGDWICSGGCSKGADLFAERLAKDYGIPILIFYPNWKEGGRGAGFERNTDIAKWSNILIACPAKDRKGGTEDTIMKFEKFHPNEKPILV